MRRTMTLAIVVSVALAGFASCASTGRSSAESTVTGLNEVRADANGGKERVKTTITTMNALENSSGGDLKPRYEAFLKELSALESSASKAKSTGQAMRDRGTAYFQKWEEQLGTMTNPDIKKRSEERRTKLNELYATLTTSMDKCRQTYETFSTDLKDIKTALDVDLSVNGVTSLKKPMKTARDHADDLEDAIVDVEKNLDSLAKEMNSIQGPKS